MEFLGHEVAAAGACPLCSYLEASESFPPSCTFKQLQAFLGLVNFYQHSLHQADQFLRPLVDVLCGGHKRNRPVTWSASMQSAYATAKKPFAWCYTGFVVDASATHDGAALQQRAAGNNSWQLRILFPKLDQAQVRYSAFKREHLVR